jgi:hypothetical protein
MCRSTCSCHKPRVWTKAGPALREHIDLRGDDTLLLTIYEPIIVSEEAGSEALVVKSVPGARCSAFIMLSTPEMDRLLIQASKQATPLGKALLRFAGSRAGLSNPDPRFDATVPLSRLPFDGTMQGVLHQADGVESEEEEEDHPYGHGLVGAIMEQRRLAHRTHSTGVFVDRDNRLARIAEDASKRQTKGLDILVVVVSATASAETVVPGEAEFADEKDHKALTPVDMVSSVENEDDPQEQVRCDTEKAAISAHAAHCVRVATSNIQVTLRAAATKPDPSPAESKKQLPPPPTNKFVFCSADQLGKALVQHERHIQGMASEPLVPSTAAAASASASASSSEARNPTPPLFSQGFNRWQ